MAMTRTTPNNGRKPQGTRECWCSGCGEMFGGTSAFERHRIGEGEDRRCLSTGEMTAHPRMVWNDTRQRWQGPTPEL